MDFVWSVANGCETEEIHFYISSNIYQHCRFLESFLKIFLEKCWEKNPSISMFLNKKKILLNF